MSRYSYSTNEENYYGDFSTIREACDEAAASAGVGSHFWVGENVPPPDPENSFSISDWLEQVSCQDEYCGDWAAGWDKSTKEQRIELETAVREMVAAWLDRHDLRPKFFNIENPRRFYVAGKVGEVFEVEAL
jgi:hypothetical protein